MSKHKPKESPQPCPISFALGIFGDRWTLLVLRDILLSARYRFKEMLAANAGMATNVLSDRLKRLEDRGLIVKQADEKDGRQFLYKPTEAGISVIPILLEMLIWGAGQGDIRIPEAYIQGYQTGREAFLKKLMREAKDQAGL